MWGGGGGRGEGGTWLYGYTAKWPNNAEKVNAKS